MLILRFEPRHPLRVGVEVRAQLVRSNPTTKRSNYWYDLSARSLPGSVEPLPNVALPHRGAEPARHLCLPACEIDGFLQCLKRVHTRRIRLW